VSTLQLVARRAKPPWEGSLGVKNGQGPVLLCTIGSGPVPVDGFDVVSIPVEELRDAFPLLWNTLIARWKQRNNRSRTGSKNGDLYGPPRVPFNWSWVNSRRRKVNRKGRIIYYQPLRFNVPLRHDPLIRVLDTLAAEQAVARQRYRESGFGRKLRNLLQGATVRTKVRLQEAVDLFYEPCNEGFRTVEGLSRILGYLDGQAELLLLTLMKCTNPPIHLSLKEVTILLANKQTPLPASPVDFYLEPLKRSSPPGFRSFRLNTRAKPVREDPKPKSRRVHRDMVSIGTSD